MGVGMIENGNRKQVKTNSSEVSRKIIVLLEIG
jgi:hypothetical protein